MLKRADVNDKVKSSLEFPFTNSCFFNGTPHTRDNDRIPILCVGRLRWISQVRLLTQVLLSLFLLRFSFSLSFSFLLSPNCNTVFVSRRTQKVSSFPAVTVRILCSRDLARICIRANYLSLVRDLPSSNILETAISVSPFRSTSQTGLCALHMPRYVASITFTLLPDLGITQRTAWSRSL